MLPRDIIYHQPRSCLQREQIIHKISLKTGFTPMRYRIQHSNTVFIVTLAAHVPDNVVAEEVRDMIIADTTIL